jgi:hypothetical protein
MSNDSFQDVLQGGRTQGRVHPGNGANMQTRLILVDGLPGSGKSTASQWIEKQLSLNGTSASWHYEISATNPLRVGVKPHNVTDDKLLDHGVQTWVDCVAGLTNADHVTVLDAGLFQHVILGAFHRNFPVEEIAHYFQRIEAVLVKTNPAFIHFSPTHASDHIARSYSNRGAKFTDRLVDWTAQSSFSKERGLEGHSGSLEFWREYHVLCSGLFDRCGLNKLKIEFQSDAPDWSSRQYQMASFLQFVQVASEVPVDDAMFDSSIFLGTYHCAEKDVRIQISRSADQLLVTGIMEPLEQTSVLSVAGPNKLVVRGHDVTLDFGQVSQGAPITLDVESTWPRIDGMTFVRC